MSRILTPGQHALLQAALELRERELDARLAAHQQGESRVEHAHEVLGQDADDAAQREGERELDLALSDLETFELAQVKTALERMRSGSYGRCMDCAEDIAFDRLKAEPWALRCVACAAAVEDERRR
jgi:DnaK suppressor protein